MKSPCENCPFFSRIPFWGGDGKLQQFDFDPWWRLPGPKGPVNFPGKNNLDVVIVFHGVFLLLFPSNLPWYCISNIHWSTVISPNKLRKHLLLLLLWGSYVHPASAYCLTWQSLRTCPCRFKVYATMPISRKNCKKYASRCNWFRRKTFVYSFQYLWTFVVLFAGWPLFEALKRWQPTRPRVMVQKWRSDLFFFSGRGGKGKFQQEAGRHGPWQYVQKLNGTLPTDPHASCNRAIRYSWFRGLFSGSCWRFLGVWFFNLWWQKNLREL